MRVARASSDLERAHHFYCHALGLSVLGTFADHEGFDGLIVGIDGANWQLELVHEHGAVIARPSVEDLIVLYLPDPSGHAARARSMLAAGYAPVRSNNPYWDRVGLTFEDHDGYRTVLAELAWSSPHASSVTPVN
jgi:catechol 2,3-dioxygenase-like lactoylglutathione lyase family enzyme